MQTKHAEHAKQNMPKHAKKIHKKCTKKLTKMFYGGPIGI